MGPPICSTCKLVMGKIKYVETSEAKDKQGRVVARVEEGENGGFFVCVNPDCVDCHSGYKRN